MRVFRLYRVVIRTAFASALAYRANFLFNMFVTVVSNILVPLVTVLIYRAGLAIPGWGFYEALLVQSVFMLSGGLCAPFLYGMVWTTSGHVKEGSYDLLLIKPHPVVLTTAALSFDLESVGSLIAGVVMFMISLVNLPPPGPAGWISFAFLLLAGAAVQAGMIFIMAAASFKWVGNSRLFEMFDSVAQFGRYPRDIFPAWLSAIISWIFPVAMIGFYPAEALLGGIRPYMFWTAVPCIVFFVFGVTLFIGMVRKYQSAGG